MITVLIVGIVLYLYGMHKTLVVYGTLCITVIAVFLNLIVCCLLTAFFMPDAIHGWEPMTGNWTQAFIARDGFTFQQGLLIPIVFFLDAIRVYFYLLAFKMNIFVLLATINCCYILAISWKVCFRFCFAGFLVKRSSERAIV